MDTIPRQPTELAQLYHQAFATYRVRALWNKHELATPNVADALVVARALRREGDRAARQLAEQIEQACHATL
jgi:hypothetical protein